MNLTLHGYWRSGTSYRTRIALNLKGLPYEIVSVDLRAGAHKQDTFTAMNPQGLVPALEADGRVLTQSPAILEWLEETFPEPPLLPGDPYDRATVRAMAAIVACDVHPLNNLRVLKAIKEFGADETKTADWIARWIQAGFEALETMIQRWGGAYAFGHSPTLADCCLVPQVYAAERFSVDISRFGDIRRVVENARAQPAFAAAHPDNQPDAG